MLMKKCNQQNNKKKKKQIITQKSNNKLQFNSIGNGYATIQQFFFSFKKKNVCKKLPIWNIRFFCPLEVEIAVNVDICKARISDKWEPYFK